MTHLETLIKNEVKKSLEKLERDGVGFIDSETTEAIYYKIDNVEIRISIKTFAEE